MDPFEFKRIMDDATPHERAEMEKLIAKMPLPVWSPLPGPQTAAYVSEADILWVGGGAGSGKSSFLVGCSLTKFKNSRIMRKQSTQLTGIIDEFERTIGSRDGYNGSTNIWRVPKHIAKNCKIEFGSCPNPGDELKFQGRPVDGLLYDEITHFNEEEFRFMNGWNRSADTKQKCQIICTGNPPTTPEGGWVLKFWGPWFDKSHPNPAKYGELRYFAMIDGKEVERPHGRAFEWKGRMITPKSRTFIFSTVEDNIFYMATGYDQNLDALPEPLRSQMRFGLFNVGVRDSDWQIFPSDWIDNAQARWTPDGHKGKPMDSVGVDVASGGSDETAISKRHGNWFSKTLRYPGKATPDGNTTAGLVISNMKDGAVIHIDIIGVGGSAYDHLNNNLIHVVGVDARKKANGKDRTGLLKFKNKRAEICWRFRELLDPANGEEIALPPDQNLKTELCAFRWKVTSVGVDGSVIQVCSKSNELDSDGNNISIRKILGRSPNEAEAVIYASIKTDKRRRGGPEDELQRMLRMRAGGGSVCA